MKRKGALRRDIVALSAKVIIDLVSSIVIGLCVTSFFIGAFLGLLIFGITSLFIKKRLVPECIQGWIRRSKFGKEGETVLGRPFKDMNEEQESLRLLLKGIVVSAIVDDDKLEHARATAMCELDSAKAFEYNKCKVTGVNKKISLDISMPYGMTGLISVDFSTNLDDLDIEKGSVTIGLKDGTESKTVAITDLFTKNTELGDKVNFDKNEKMASLSSGGEIVGNKLIIRDGDGMGYVSDLDKIEIDSSVSIKKADDRLNISMVKNIFIDEVVNTKKPEVCINIVIRAKGQVFNEVFRSQISFLD